MASRKIFAEFLILIAIIGGIWLGLTLAPCNKPSMSPMISVEDEEKLGKFFAEELTRKKKIEDEFVTSSIQKIQKRLTDKLPDSPYTYKIIVVRDPMINAFALPGGYLIVHTSLLKLADSAEEVASVVAHEMGHTEKNHIIKRLIVKLGVQVINIILTGGDSVVIGEAASMMANNTFTQSQELEADNFALDLLHKTNIDPRILAKFFRKMQEETEVELPEALNILSTHPDTNERIQNALTYKIAKDFNEKPIEINWRKLKSRL